ncbi:protein S-acyltransferase 18 [Rutidosis leptorrhynchoides]|uniref:protein S-acyltransferase 18 n=1 Tax=Rutidosis leptorrhynchoides TaxID=125765 RepID=UPI003A99F7C8
MMRRHGWQRPLHSLQIVGMAIYGFLVAAFYTFLGLFVYTRTVVIVITSIYSFTALAVMFLFIRCTAIDPTDKTNSKRKKKRSKSDSKQLNYGLLLSHIVMRFFTKIERKILRKFIRRKYLDPLSTTAQMEPLIPFPLVIKDDSVSPGPLQDDISFCALCDSQVKKQSKHCRTCNRCVEGFDHHCRWLNNCVGKKNYRTFILLLVSVLLMLIIEGGTAIAIFVRCFTDAKGIDMDLLRMLHFQFPRGLLLAICVLLVLLTAYGSAALGQLFFFHVVLIRKGMRTYDYIMAMKEENQLLEDDSDMSSDDESIDMDSPEKTRFTICRERIPENQHILSVRIDKEPPPVIKKQGFRASISPWKLITMSREKAQLAADKAREKFMREKVIDEEDDDRLKPLPLETKSGPSLMTANIDNNKGVGIGATPLVVKGMLSSPRRRYSVSPSTKQKYKSNFDLKLTEVSRELETYISRKVLCSVVKNGDNEPSPSPR